MNLLETPKEKEITDITEETKQSILKKLQPNDFETLCLRFGIKKLNINAKDRKHLDRYINYLKGKIALEDLVKYAEEQKIDVSELLSDYQKRINYSRQKFDEDYYPNTGNSAFEEVLNDISMKFLPEKCRDDEELQLQLAQFLKIKYPSKVLKLNEETSAGIISIIFDSTYGLKPAIADSRDKLRSVVGEIKDYLKICTDAAAIIMDDGLLTSEEIEEYAREITDFGGYFVVINQYVRQKKIEIKV
ncbi:MAG: hypothetical protein M1284_01335 [Candidatus Parvarchaeota archaeon]|jgi:hypothetical protein|nr:hypothetical protein [Candidatus Parvarchaeota archaeon]MCL5420377.1 hypothetical protein [Candidatus Parvarchaeota archaeon]